MRVHMSNEMYDILSNEVDVLMERYPKSAEILESILFEMQHYLLLPEEEKSILTDDIRILKDVFAYVRINQIHSLAELLDICSLNNPDWFSTITMSRAYIVDKYIKSLAWEEQNKYVRKSMIDAETGEIIAENKE